MNHPSCEILYVMKSATVFQRWVVMFFLAESQTLKPEVVTHHSRAQQSEVIGRAQLVKNMM